MSSIDWKSLGSAESEAPFMHAAVEVLKSVIEVAVTCAGSTSETPHGRDAGIRCGMLVRACKHAAALVRDICRDRGELQLVLLRMLVETTANLERLCRNPSVKDHEAYAMDSLISEREFLAVIAKRVASDSEAAAWPIEQRMRRSVERSARAASVELDQIPGRARIGWPSAQSRVEDAHGFGAYLSFRAGSDAVHGGWNDLFRNHLSERDGGFDPNFDGVRPRPQAPITAAILLAKTCVTYLQLRPAGDRQALEPELQDLFGAARRLDALHEEFTQRRYKLTPDN